MEDRRYSQFVEADFSGSRFRGVDFSNVRITDAWLMNVEISGHVAGLSINGVDVGEYVELQLDERHPERRLLTADDGAGMSEAWSSIEHAAAATLERARRLPADRLDESVDDEWSFLETLRHLVFATDRWITGPVLSEPEPFHPLGLPNPPHDELPPDVFDLGARPSLDEMVLARRGRMDRVNGYLATASADDLDRDVASPNGGRTSVRRCLHVVFNEEWWHNQYANRDLGALEHR